MASRVAMRAIVVVAVLAVAAFALFATGIVGPPGGLFGSRSDGVAPDQASADHHDATSDPAAARLAKGGDAARGEVAVRLLAYRDRSPIHGQPVRLVSDKGVRFEIATGEDGRVLFSRVPAGPDWTLSVEPPGLAMVEVKGIAVKAGARTELDDLLIGAHVVLRGRVIDGRGQPVPGASVAAYGSTLPDMSRGVVATLLADALEVPTPADEAKSDDRGFFALASLSPGTYRLATKHPGYAQDVKMDLIVAAERAASNVTVVLGPAAVVRGKVTDESGAAVASARVVALEDVAGAARFRGAPTAFKKDWTITAADGSYVLDTLTRGASYRFGVVASGHAPVFDTSPTAVEAEMRRDFTLEKGGSIEGKVLDAKTGQPISGAKVLALTGVLSMGGGRGPRTSDPTTGTSASSGTAQTAADGTFKIDGLRPGPVAIGQVHASGYADASASQFTGNPWGEVKSGDTLSVEVRLDPGGVVRGHVLAGGPGGPPIPGAQVMALSFSSIFSGYPTAQTDSEGAYRIDGVRTGQKVGISASAPGFVAPNPFDPTTQITVPDGGGEVVHDLVLSAAGSVEGTVVDGKRVPVSGARVRARPAPGGGGRGGFGFLRGLFAGGGGGVVLTDDQGHYRLDHVASEERFVVEADSDEYVPNESEPFDLRAGDVKKVDLVLYGGATIRGRVLDDGGHVVPGASIRIGRLDEETSNTKDLSGWRVDTLLEARSFASDAGGLYEIPRVQPGHVILKVEATGYVTSYRRDLLAKADEPMDNVVLTMVRSETISGVVKGDDGRPIPNAVVAVTKQANPSRFGGGGASTQSATTAPDPNAEPSVEPTMTGRTDDSGRFTVEGVPPNASYSVLVWFAMGYRGWSSGNDQAIRRGVAAGSHDVELVLAKADPNENPFPMRPPGVPTPSRPAAPTPTPPTPQRPRGGGSR